ncbi:MAG: hypothetical protein E4H36_08040 [Spirochaetales bacterium]|nr:MAG: hypothetical protein E4H36_08040 [Spirochaetales bacterium]
MYTYRLMAGDGIEHIFKILSEEPDNYNVETIHRFHTYEVVAKRIYNKCLFEELLNLGIITKVS